MTDNEMLCEIYSLQAHVNNINNRLKKLIKELDSRVKENGKVRRNSKSMTKEQILNKWLNKY